MDVSNTLKPIGAYTLCSTGAVLVYQIDHQNDRVLAGINDNELQWCDVTEQYWEHSEQGEIGFCFGEMFIPFCEVMRITGGAA